MLERWFALGSHKTTAVREIQAGLTTFAAMAYILAVNPSILAETGMDRAALVTVTALSAAAATALMALLTNYPLALAPGHGDQRLLHLHDLSRSRRPVAAGARHGVRQRCVFLALSLTGVREKIIDAIPHSLKLAITGGIGLFIAFIGLKNGGVVVASPATLVTHGDFTSGSARCAWRASPSRPSSSRAACRAPS